MRNSYLEEDKTTKNVKKEKSHIKALLSKPIVKPTPNVKATRKPYSYTAAVLQRECMVIANSGTTCHFLQIQSECVDKRGKNDGMQVKLPDGTITTSTHTVLLNIKQLPMKACSAHLFPDIKHVLLSISTLCNEGYMEIFDEEKVYIIKDSTILLHGNRDPRTNLYMVNIISNEMTVQPKLKVKHMENLGGITKFANNTYELKVKKDLITYYQKCCFSPVRSTWIREIDNGNFCTWPGLTAHVVRKHLPKSTATAKCHMQ